MYEMEDKMDDAKIEYRKLKREEEILRLEGKKERLPISSLSLKWDCLLRNIK